MKFLTKKLMIHLYLIGLAFIIGTYQLKELEYLMLADLSRAIGTSLNLMLCGILFISSFNNYRQAKIQKKQIKKRLEELNKIDKEIERFIKDNSPTPPLK